MTRFTEAEAQTVMDAFDRFIELRHDHPAVSAQAALTSLQVALGFHGIRVTHTTNPDIPPWVCHDHSRWYAVVHPDRVNQAPDQPNDQVPPLARLVAITDSAGNPLPLPDRNA